MGSVYRRKSDGRWMAAISTGPRGKRTVMVRSARSRREARALLDELRQLARPAVGSGRTTVGAYLRSWLDTAGRRSLKASTLWVMRRDRMGNRRRIEGEIAVRWLRRFIERQAATLTSDPVLTLVADCYFSDHWIRGGSCLTISARMVLGGRRFGLPERLTSTADVVAVPVPDSPLEGAVTTPVTVKSLKNLPVAE